MLTNSLLQLTSKTFGSKIAPSATTVTASSPSVANRGAHKTLAGLVFQAHNGLECHPMSYRTYSYFMIGFTLGQVTLFDAHKLIFAKTHKTHISQAKRR